MTKALPRLGTLYRLEIVKSFNLLGYSRVLDVGSYDGLILNKIPADWKIGVDLAPIYSDNAVQIRADVCQLPFQNETFDLVIALDVIEHVPNDRSFAASLVSVLRPGGRLLLTTPSKYIRMTPPFLTDYIGKKWGHTLRPGYTADELESLFPSGSMRLQYQYFNAKRYRRYYLIARILFPFLPGFVAGWISSMARQDLKSGDDEHGFVLLNGWKT